VVQAASGDGVTDAREMLLRDPGRITQIHLPAGSRAILELSVSLERVLDHEALGRALLDAGLSDGDGEPPMIDASQDDGDPVPMVPPDDEHARERLALLRETWRSWNGTPSFRGKGVRFVCQADRDVVLESTDVLEWLDVQPLEFDPFADIVKEVRPLEVLAGASYDVRFISRMAGGIPRGSEGTRGRVLQVLAVMGFLPNRLSCLKKNIRMPGRSGVDCAVWCGTATWMGSKTVLTVEEPLTFEDCLLVHPAGPPVEEGGASDEEGGAS
jgi:hypothetical protein